MDDRYPEEYLGMNEMAEISPRSQCDHRLCDPLHYPPPACPPARLPKLSSLQSPLLVATILNLTYPTFHNICRVFRVAFQHLSPAFTSIPNLNSTSKTRFPFLTIFRNKQIIAPSSPSTEIQLLAYLHGTDYPDTNQSFSGSEPMVLQQRLLQMRSNVIATPTQLAAPVHR